MSISHFDDGPLSDARSRVGLLVCLGMVALAIGSSACATARASSVPNGPPLDVPAAPARVIVPAEEPLQVAAPAPADPAPAAAAPPRTPPRNAPEPKPQPPAPAAAAVSPPPAATDGRDLRAATSPENTATERSVRDTLTRATRDINRVDYRILSADGRAQYDQSKRFSQQAEAALQERNYVFAATLADKAAQIAAELLK
jgi:hypothetical protein